MHTRIAADVLGLADAKVHQRAVGGFLFTIACLAFMMAISVADAQNALSGDRLFRNAISAMLNLKDDKGSPLIPADHAVVVDAEAFDRLVAPLGLAIDRVKQSKAVVAGRTVQLKSWKNTESCKMGNGRERCTLPAAVTALRFFSPTWLVRGKVISIETGLYHRSELGRDDAGIGGSVRELRLELRDGRWVLISVMVKAVA